MRYLQLSSLILILFYCSCYKSPVNNNPKPVYNNISFNGVNLLNPNGVTVTVTAADSTVAELIFHFDLIAAGRSNEQVSCSLSGLPAGIINTTPNGSFTLPTTWTLRLNINNADTGMYNVDLNISGAYGSRAFPFRLHITPVPAYNAGLDHIYYGSDPCGNYPSGTLGSLWYTYTCVMTALPGYPHTVKLQNYRGFGDSFFLYANVTGKAAYANLKVPFQTSGGYTIYGTGFASPDTGPGGTEEPFISIDDTIVHSGDTQICHSQLLQHPW